MHDGQNEQTRPPLLNGHGVSGEQGTGLQSAGQQGTSQQGLVPAGGGHQPPAMPDLYRQPGYPGDQYPDDGVDLAATLQQYLRLVVKRKWLILSSILAFVTLGGLITLMKTPLYTATARIQIERQAAKVVEGGETTGVNTRGNDFMRTQYELLKSRAMAERVVSSLQLTNDDDFFKPRNASLTSIIRGAISSLFAKNTDNVKMTPQIRQRIATGTVAANFAVRPVRGSRLVDLRFTDPSPARAKKIANAYANSYVASNLDKRFEANQYAKTFLDDQIKQLNIRLQESEKRLLDFAQKAQIVQVSEKSSIAESNLAAANAAMGKLISERIKNEQLWRQVKNAGAINLPQLLTNSVIDGLRANRNKLQTEYEDKLETFKPSYPAMVRISNRIKEIDRQLAREVKTIRFSLKAAYESSRNQVEEMKKRITKLRSEVLELQKSGIQYNILKRDVDSNREQYNSLLKRFKEVDIAGGVGTNNVFIVDRALKPGGPSSPKLRRALLLSLLLGLGVGVGMAYLLEILDDRIRAPEDIQSITGLPTLGIIPSADSEELFHAQMDDPRSAISEAYRSLATALQLSSASGLPRSIAITSTGPSEGKSSTALAVARHFAMMEQRVLLIDADLRKPSLHTKLGQDNAIGLSTYLTGSASPPEVIQTTIFPNLSLMASGPLPPNAADLLGGTRIFSLISVGLEVYDLIIIDTPPLLGLADAQLLSSAASATVFVVAAGQQRKGMIRSAIRRLQLARSTPIGTVLTKFDSDAVGYGYGYGYGYGTEAYSYGSTVDDASGRQDQGQLTQNVTR